jgi:hypothetical protein
MCKGKPNLKCDVCQKTFQDKAGKKQHMNRVKCKPFIAQTIIEQQLPIIEQQLPIIEQQLPIIEQQLPTITRNNRADIFPEVVSGETNEGCIYLLIEREFRKTKENIYKIGKTRNLKHRLQDYPIGSLLLFSNSCPSLDESEDELLKQFNKRFIQRKDIGTEYFEGDVNLMKNIIIRYFYKKNKAELFNKN